MLILVAGPSAPPITLAEVKEQIRGLDTSTAEDPYVKGLITTAIGLVETFMGRALITQTWDYYMDFIPELDIIEIPKVPLTSVVSIKTFNEDDSELVFATSNYIVDILSEPGRIALKTGATWPTTHTSFRPINGFAVRFVAGYAEPENIPQAIKTGIIRAVDALYSVRKFKTESKSGAQLKPLPIGLPSNVQEILIPYKLFKV